MILTRLFFVIALAWGGWFFWTREETPVVNVYNWYNMLPPDVLEDFYKETGIRVRVDFYDNNDVVQAKLLAGNSGYDVVFPTASPYLSAQIKAGVYQPLNKALIPSYDAIEPALRTQMHTVDPGNIYAVPYYWGTIGFAYNEDMIKARMPNAPVDSYALLFDPKVVAHFKDCGVTLLEESTDIYPVVLNFIGKPADSDRLDDLKAAQKHLMEIRPCIRRFSSSRIVGELTSGETCLAQTWSGDTQMAVREAKKLGKNLRYVIPKEGTSLWIDAMAIPKDAPNPKNAHLFIEFVLRPDIAARISQLTLLATPTRAAYAFIPRELREDPSIFPPPEMMENLRLDPEHNLDYERVRNRYWMDFRIHQTS